MSKSCQLPWPKKEQGPTYLRGVHSVIGVGDEQDILGRADVVSRLSVAGLIGR